jgi:hypothetical protein
MDRWLKIWGSPVAHEVIYGWIIAFARTACNGFRARLTGDIFAVAWRDDAIALESQCV